MPYTLYINSSFTDTRNIDYSLIISGTPRNGGHSTIMNNGSYSSIVGEYLKFDVNGYISSGYFQTIYLNYINPNGTFQSFAVSTGGYSENIDKLLSVARGGGSDFSFGSSLEQFYQITSMGWNNTIYTGDYGCNVDAYNGNDTIIGGTGNDRLGVQRGANYIRGGDGNDILYGGSEFDDLNGNQGNDVCYGGVGDDWVVGGKDNDELLGNAGDDIVYGNLGNDTCDGGAGNDIVRGGQGDDILTGGAGNDWVSGDKGSDTMTGGAGADIFHSFGDAGIDRVTDFRLSEGDRVQLDPGTVYTLSQSGADTLINMTGGGQMILVGVQLSTLTAGWIFGA